MPPGHCLAALKCSSRNLQFMVPFTKEKIHWCPCPFWKQSIQAWNTVFVIKKDSLSIALWLYCIVFLYVIVSHHNDHFIHFHIFLWHHLKALDTFGSCQDQSYHLVYRDVFRAYKICENFGSIGHPICKRIMKDRKKKHPCCVVLCAFRCIIKGFSWSLFIIWVRNYLFLKNYVTWEGFFSHNVLYTMNSSPLLITK